MVVCKRYRMLNKILLHITGPFKVRANHHLVHWLIKGCEGSYHRRRRRKRGRQRSSLLVCRGWNWLNSMPHYSTRMIWGNGWFEELVGMDALEKWWSSGSHLNKLPLSKNGCSSKNFSLIILAAKWLMLHLSTSPNSSDDLAFSSVWFFITEGIRKKKQLH